MNPIYKVFLGDYLTKSCYDYEEAKKDFIEWVDYLKSHVVAYNTVSVVKDFEVMLEYKKD